MYSFIFRYDDYFNKKRNWVDCGYLGGQLQNFCGKPPAFSGYFLCKSCAELEGYFFARQNYYIHLRCTK